MKKYLALILALWAVTDEGRYRVLIRNDLTVTFCNEYENCWGCTAFHRLPPLISQGYALPASPRGSRFAAYYTLSFRK